MLLGADRQEVPLAVYSGQDLVEADLSDVPDVYQDLHWHAPKTYLGDKVRDRRRTVSILHILDVRADGPTDRQTDWQADGQADQVPVPVRAQNSSVAADLLCVSVRLR